MKLLEELGISPTPWKVSPRDNTLVTTHDGYRVAVGCCERYDGGRGNAQLIAAAPKMYQKLMEAVEDKCCFCTASEDERRELCDLCIVADWKAALAEAAGEEVDDGK